MNKWIEWIIIIKKGLGYYLFVSNASNVSGAHEIFFFF